MDVEWIEDETQICKLLLKFISFWRLKLNFARWDTGVKRRYYQTTYRYSNNNNWFVPILIEFKEVNSDGICDIEPVICDKYSKSSEQFVLFYTDELLLNGNVSK